MAVTQDYPDSVSKYEKWLWPGALAALAILSLVVAGRDLGNISFWYDETFSANAAHLPVSQLWDLSWQIDPHTTLWHFFLKLWYGIYNGGEAYGRIPSLVFGAAAVVMTANLGRKLFNASAGFAAGLVMTFSTALLSYQHEGRPYTLAALLTVLAMTRLQVFAEQPSTRNAALVGATCAFAMYAHPFCALAFIAVLPTFFITNRKVLSARAFAAGIAAFVVTAIPFVALFSANIHSDNLSWIPAFDSDTVKTSLYLISGTRLMTIMQVEIAVIVIGAAVAIWRKDKRELAALAFVLSWLVLTPAIAFVIDTMKAVLVDRYLMPAVPAFALALGFAIDSIVRLVKVNVARPIAAIAVAIALFAYANGDHSTQFKIHNNWQDAMSMIAGKAKPDDMLIAPHFDPVMVYYGQKHENTRNLLLVDTGKTVTQSRHIAAFKQSPVDSEDITKALANTQHDVWMLSVIDDWDQRMEPYLKGIDDNRRQSLGESGAIRVEILHPGP